MKELFLLAIVIMVFVVIFQIAKASEYVSVLKGEEKTRKQNNKINGFLLIAFLIFGLIGVYVCNEWFFHKTLFPQGSASVEGEKIDFMLYLTIGVTGFIFIITQILLFWFAFKYQEKEGKKAFFFPHNTKLELLWTTVPAIFLTILVVFGLINWRLQLLQSTIRRGRPQSVTHFRTAGARQGYRACDRSAAGNRGAAS